MMKIGSLFAGVGGLELGLERAGVGHTVWQVELDDFCRSVLTKHWPNVERHADVRAVGSQNLSPVGVICGGFPCVDISFAGLGAGLAGERSGLWWEFARIVRELRPRFVVVENVAALLVRGVDDVLGTLASLGYDAEWSCVRACDVGAPHRRDRLFIVAQLADADGVRCERDQPVAGSAGEATSPRLDGHATDDDGQPPGRRETLADADGERRKFERIAEHGSEQGASGGEPDGCGERRRWHGSCGGGARRRASGRRSCSTRTGSKRSWVFRWAGRHSMARSSRRRAAPVGAAADAREAPRRRQARPRQRRVALPTAAAPRPRQLGLAGGRRSRRAEADRDGATVVQEG